MQKCGNCGHENRAGVVFCENCGASLIGRQPLSTKALETASGNQASSSAIPSPLSAIVQEMATFKPGDSLKLHVEGAAKPLELQPKGEVILGRRDPATGATPDVDLTPFAGYRMGVSRRHAAIRQGDDNTLNVWDLGSSNGTFLNGQRLNAHRPYPLHDGDELRLGQMIIRVHFKPAAVAVAEPAPPPPPPPTTKPLQPLPQPTPSAAPAADKETAAPAAPAVEKEASPARPVTGPAPTEAPAASEAKPAAPATPEPLQPAPSVAETAAPPVTSPATVPQVAEQPPSALVIVPQPAEQSASQVAPTPETAAPAQPQPDSAPTEAKPAAGVVPPAASQEDQKKAPPPSPVAKSDEPGAGENNTTPPDS